MLTLHAALAHARTALRVITETPALDAELLLARALERDRSYLHAHPEAVLNEAQRRHFDNMVQRRAQGEPLAYILGFKEFWSLKLRVTQDVLIPRPETELLVELALARIPERARWNVADLGTGSGAIAIAIAKERPDASVVATDISYAALTLAADNAMRLGIANARFVMGNWFAPLRESFHVIISNPPYVDADDPHLRNPALRFEPSQALISAERGLADLKRIVRCASTFLCPGGALIVEHGFEQAAATRELFERSGFSGVKTYRDFAGRERATLGRRETNSSHA
ncbi:MAG: peptide chain release factor N(5)-glutamine methyltransferase [Gammaproteobacteria bacterium]|nr:peptide chain release factor N(5)-glutamine methyltransferase [Gammaproteobacteria bacterium]